MKIAVIGGGGVRSMFLAKSLSAKAGHLGVDELVFMDNDPLKLRIYGKMAAKVASLINPALRFTLTADPIEAVRDADYVITTIRVGGDLMRCRDERIALDEGVLGQETTGAGGFSFAMRSIPALSGYCELVKSFAKPYAKVFNFTNPAGIVSESLREAGYDFCYGICDAPSGMLRQFAAFAGAEKIEGEVYGLNHLSFFVSVKADGNEILPELINNPDAYRETDLRYFDPVAIQKKGFIPNEYLYYYYNTESAVKNILKAPVTRGEIIAYVNQNMTEELSKLDIDKDFETALKIFGKWHGIRENSYMASESGVKKSGEWKFDPFSPDEGGYAGVALRYMEIVRSGKQGSMILCIPNNGALDFLKPSDVIEVSADIYPGGETTHRFPDVPEENAALISAVKLYEREGAKAILNRDRAGAVKALSAHPLIGESRAESLTDKYISLNEPYCGGWK